MCRRPGVFARVFAEQRIGQVLDGLGLRHHPVGKPYAAYISKPHDQFDAFQAAESELAFQVSRRTARGQFFGPARSAQLHQQLAHRCQCLRFN